MKLEASIATLFDRDAHNVVVDNNTGNYSENLRHIPKDASYSWFHVKNAYHKDNYRSNRDPHFCAVDSLTQLGSSKLFDQLAFDTNRLKVQRDVRLNHPELRYWKGSGARIGVGVEVEGLKVIHGKKVGRTLGIPTGRLTSEPGGLQELPGAAQPHTRHIQRHSAVQEHVQRSARPFEGQSVQGCREPGVQPAIPPDKPEPGILTRRSSY